MAVYMSTGDIPAWRSSQKTGLRAIGPTHMWWVFPRRRFRSSHRSRNRPMPGIGCARTLWWCYALDKLLQACSSHGRYRAQPALYVAKEGTCATKRGCQPARHGMDILGQSDPPLPKVNLGTCYWGDFNGAVQISYRSIWCMIKIDSLL